ncbi:MAG: peptidase [Chloroflexi bacterium]|nr:peptidase [Chloroflexota bacterium]
MKIGKITDIKGITVGHYTNKEKGTGCTVLLCENGATGGVDVRGTAPGTRETDLLKSGQLVEKIHGISLSGGSAFGLDTAGGVMRYLVEKNVGYNIGTNVIPIVPSAILFDLNLLSNDFSPSITEGYTAAKNASIEFDEGSVGAATGATVSKMLGWDRCLKGGIGSYCITLDNGIQIGAIAAVNAAGDIVDPKTGNYVSKPYDRKNKTFDTYMNSLLNSSQSSNNEDQNIRENTTLGIVATNLCLDKSQTNKLAERGQDGFAMTIQPCHMPGDGDVVFSISTWESSQNIDRSTLTSIYALAPMVMSEAIIRGTRIASSLGGVPSCNEIQLSKDQK